MRPHDVLSPRASWQLTDVLYEGKHWSLALGKWKDADGTWRPVLAQRWNGEGDDKGMPISTGHAVWFVIPGETYPLYINSRFIPDAKRSFVKALLGLDDQAGQAA